MSVINLVLDNLEAFLAGILATQVLAQAIVNLTHTPWEESWVYRVYRVIEFVAGLWTRRAKELPGEDLG